MGIAPDACTKFLKRLSNFTQWLRELGERLPEALVLAVIARLRELGASSVTEMPGERETIAFKLPPELAPGRIANA